MEPEVNGWGDEDLELEDLDELGIDLNEDVFQSAGAETEEKKEEVPKNPVDAFS